MAVALVHCWLFVRVLVVGKAEQKMKWISRKDGEEHELSLALLKMQHEFERVLYLITVWEPRFNQWCRGAREWKET
jgi:hypothetical protein